MEKPWQYLVNQFIGATRNNYKKALTLSNYHYAVLYTQKETNPLLVPLYDRYHPLHLALTGEYSQFNSKRGVGKSKTVNMRQQLKLAYTNMDKWAATIQLTGEEFRKGTPNYKAIFARGRKVFTNGPVIERVNAYGVLAESLLPFAPLATIMAEVAAVYETLNSARAKQVGTKGTVKSGSQNLDKARIAAMTMQWRNLAICMDMYWDKLGYAESLFDLRTLRHGLQSKFTGTLAPGKNEAVLTHTFMATDRIKLKNMGNAPISFYLASAPHRINSYAIELAPGEEKTITISEFNAPDLHIHRFLTAVNHSASETTKYVVRLL